MFAARDAVVTASCNKSNTNAVRLDITTKPGTDPAKSKDPGYTISILFLVGSWRFSPTLGTRVMYGTVSEGFSKTQTTYGVLAHMQREGVLRVDSFEYQPFYFVWPLHKILGDKAVVASLQDPSPVPDPDATCSESDIDVESDGESDTGDERGPESSTAVVVGNAGKKPIPVSQPLSAQEPVALRTRSRTRHV
jgi:hypothetical protein